MMILGCYIIDIIISFISDLKFYNKLVVYSLIYIKIVSNGLKVPSTDNYL